MKLTPKQELFCNEYLIDLNATQAAIRAKYSPKTAMEQASRLLSNVKVQEYIQQRMKDREKRTEITQDRVLKELAHIAFDDIKNYLSFYTDTDGNVRTIVKDSTTIDTRAIQEVSQGKDGQFKFKMYCKDNALLQVGKHLGMFKEQIEHSGETTVNNKVDLTGFTTEQLKEMLKE
jgi:phage terminase small subunit